MNKSNINTIQKVFIVTRRMMEYTTYNTMNWLRMIVLIAMFGSVLSSPSNTTMICKKKAHHDTYKKDECDWKSVLKKYDNTFPRHVFKRERGEIICISSGKWPDHSRSPCDIGEKGFGGVDEIYLKECGLNLKDEGKLICSIQPRLYDSSVRERLNFIDAKLSCECSEKENLHFDTCKWKITVEFKEGQADWSTEASMFVSILGIMLFILYLSISSDICGDGNVYINYWDDCVENDYSIPYLFCGESE